MTVKHELLIYSKDITSAVNKKFHSCTFGPSRDSPEYQKQVDETKGIIKDERVGLYMSIIGTLIWSYAGYFSVPQC